MTASPEALASTLRGLQPAACSFASPLDLGSVVGLVQPLAVAEEADGGKVEAGGAGGHAGASSAWEAARLIVMNDGIITCITWHVVDTASLASAHV